MKANSGKKTQSSFTLQEALNEFYKASNHKCEGVTAQANDVFQLANKANSKAQLAMYGFSFLEKAGACLHSIEFFAAVLDDGIVHPAKSPSALVWGCLKHLLKVSTESFA